MASAQQRHRRILDLLARNGYESIVEMASLLGVSPMTVRRDLNALENEGLIRRTHGGAVSETLGQIDLDYSARRTQHARAKRQIAAAAAELVHAGDVVFLDAGTTVLAMTEFLSAINPLTVVTHSLPVVDRLAGRDGIDVFLLGGLVRRDLMSVVGYRAEEHLASFRIDTCFLGTGNLDPDRGLAHSTLEEIPIKKLAARIAGRVIVLADHTKVGSKGLVYFLNIDEINTWISNGKDRAALRHYHRPSPAGRGDRNRKKR
jgi:DeoR/GlpR family transcriptional regulator of sugar metabolism